MGLGTGLRLEMVEEIGLGLRLDIWMGIRLFIWLGIRPINEVFSNHNFI